MKLKVKHIAGTVPTRAYPTDSGLDMYAAEGVVILPGQTVRVRTGVAIELPEGMEGQVRPRSSLASKGIYALLGTIDQSYRGEIGVILTNLSSERYAVKPSDRVAQLVVCRVALPSIELVDELTPSDRGAGGVGSTGR